MPADRPTIPSDTSREAIHDALRSWPAQHSFALPPEPATPAPPTDPGHGEGGSAR